MGKFIFIIGGVRSGKSGYARDRAKKLGKKVVFVATCVPEDAEMKHRVALHKKSRPRYWKTIEEPRNLKPVLGKVKNKFDVILIDCMGLLISNFLAAGFKEGGIKKELESIIRIIGKTRATTILVSNEVGGGLIPQNLLARRFTDLMGFANQIMAEKADEVIHMQAGIPIIIKGESKRCKN